MSFRLTRRSLVLAIGAAPLVAQQPPLTPQQRLDKANLDIREVSDKLAALTVPMETEPAFRFVA